MTVLLGPGAVVAEHDRWDEDPAARMLVCTRIVRRTAQIATFEFVASDRRALPHDPGQYVTLSAEIGGERVSRCYTVSSPSTRPYSVQVTVKREPDGIMSRWLHDALRVGDRVEVSGPAGDFTTAGGSSDRLLLLAGGVGITPMLSIVESVNDLADDADIVLVHNSHAPELVAFAPELARLTAENPRIRVVQAVSADPAGTWTGPVGRLNAEMLAAAVPDLADRDVFVCGPDPYMAHATTLLAGMGADPSRIRQESFVLAEPAEAAGPAGLIGAGGEATADAGTHTVTFAKAGKSIAVADGQTVLQAAKEVGVRIPTSCQNGLCGTCKIVKVSGDVDIAHNGGIRQREIDQGKILACCSRPRGPVVVEA